MAKTLTITETIEVSEFVEAVTDRLEDRINAEILLPPDRLPARERDRLAYALGWSPASLTRGQVFRLDDVEELVCEWVAAWLEDVGEEVLLAVAHVLEEEVPAEA